MKSHEFSKKTFGYKNVHLYWRNVTLSQELKGNVLTHFPRQDRMIKTLVAECHLHPCINAIAASSRTSAIFSRPNRTKPIFVMVISKSTRTFRRVIVLQFFSLHSSLILRWLHALLHGWGDTSELWRTVLSPETYFFSRIVTRDSGLPCLIHRHEPREKFVT